MEISSFFVQPGGEYSVEPSNLKVVIGLSTTNSSFEEMLFSPNDTYFGPNTSKAPAAFYRKMGNQYISGVAIKM